MVLEDAVAVTRPEQVALRTKTKEASLRGPRGPSGSWEQRAQVETPNGETETSAVQCVWRSAAYFQPVLNSEQQNIKDIDLLSSIRNQLKIIGVWAVELNYDQFTSSSVSPQSFSFITLCCHAHTHRMHTCRADKHARLIRAHVIGPSAAVLPSQPRLLTFRVKVQTLVCFLSGASVGPQSSSCGSASWKQQRQFMTELRLRWIYFIFYFFKVRDSAASAPPVRFWCEKWRFKTK